jgi:hypothetical protein
MCRLSCNSGRSDGDPGKDRPLAPHFIVPVARGADVAKVRTPTDLCCLREKVDIQRPKRASAMQALPVLWTHAA